MTREAGNINHRLSAAYLNNHNITDNLRSFVARSRLQTLQCESLLALYYPKSYTKACKICHHPSETVSHILNGCTTFQRLYQHRHNRIVDILYDKIKDNNSCTETLKDTVLQPQLFNCERDKFIHPHTKPDITIIDRNNKHVFLLEVSTPFDAHIPICYQGKFDKYFPLSLEINSMGFRTEIIVIVIGSLGNVHNNVTSGLIKAGLSRNNAKSIAKYCSISSIIGSYKVWKMRCKYYNNIS